MSRWSARAGWFGTALFVFALPMSAAHAQQDPSAPASDSTTDVTGRPRLLVTGIAGSTIYLTLETALVPLELGQILDVAGASEGPSLGRLVVLERAAGRILTRFDGEAFPVTRGTMLYLASDRAVVAGPQAPTPLPRETARERRTRTTRERGAAYTPGPRVSGFFALESDLRRSSSNYVTAADGVFGGSGGTVERTFATPGARVRATLAGLPAGLRLHTSIRAYHRERVSRRPVNESEFQLFEAYVAAEPLGSPLKLQAGRFLNRHEAFRGYWDGGLVRVGTDRFGLGVSAGWEPVIRDDGLNQDLLKYAAFVGTETGSRSTRYAASLSATRLDSRVGGVDRTIVGAAQRLTAGQLRLNASLEAERDTATNTWLISRFHASARVRAGRLSIRTSASRLRGPVGVAFDPGLDPGREASRTGPARDRIGAGLSLRVGAGSIGGDATVSRDRGDRSSRTYAGHVLLPRALPGDVSLRLNGFYWEDDRANDATSGSVGFSRRFGKVHADVGYLIDRSQRSGFGVTSHGLLLGFRVSGSTGWRYDMSGFARRGSELETDRLYTRLSKSF